MAVAGCINAYDCAGCYLTTLQQLQSDNIGVAINYTAPGEYGRRQLDYIKYTDKCGCTCCLTGENELRIVATQGVIKNFTLTNDDMNERVIVKWNDLFGSNRAYTMVRYKTGSYPTSITDGTLAVKETTQNQYSVSGYNVSGLTDGTTYYFTAFAVSQNGTVIVVQNKTITPSYTRKPTANTLYFINFNTNSAVVDSSGNNHSIIDDGPVRNTGGVVEGCRRTNADRKRIRSPFNSGETFPTKFTIMAFIKPSGNHYTNDHPMGIALSNESAKVVRGIGFTQTNSSVQFNHLRENVAWDDKSVSPGVPILNVWRHYAMTVDGTTMKGYIDGVLKGTRTVSGNGSSTPYPLGGLSIFGRYVSNDSVNPSGLANTIYGYVDEAICENKVREVADFTNYFAKIKYIPQ